ncbi:hypothetical protein RYB35_11895 [Pseudomonas syringae pv. actinidiae]|nr:hypothetical protein [Pseudomonas syringae pv. actinidiae]MDU8553906.1 hypothetical protein [Pseudomonas syringae pv. actinidiae]MDU8596154.1 hypothetical protein [Pseudomonas syringae pv. actinidiae]MDU8624289.1 hypothetical protein [Pseudomonas syringae pv. actinidiae]
MKAIQRSFDQTAPETAKRPVTPRFKRIDKGCVVPDWLTVPLSNLRTPTAKDSAEKSPSFVLQITQIEIKRALRTAA